MNDQRAIQNYNA